VNETNANDQVRQSLNAISAALTTEALLQLNGEVANAGENTVPDVAKRWLTSNNLG
jgi:osmoprotectant transport system substrate-binding protein